MKIIEIIPQLSSGGGERFTVDLCNEMAERGHNVVLCVLHTLHEGTSGFYLPQVSEKVRVISMNKRSGFDVRLFLKIFKLVRREKPDVLHTHLRGIVYALLPLLFVVRGLHTVHSDAAVEASEWFSCHIRKWLFRHKRCIPVTISEESHKSFVNFYGMDAPLIPNGRNIPQDLVVSDKVKAEMAQFRKDADTRPIVQLAHIDKVKRQVLMANVATRLYNEGYHFSILFIGSDRDEAYTAQVREAMPPCCHILGQRTNPLEYLKAAGAFALCSSYEGLPISLIEALGVGAVPICTPVGGIVNLINDGKSGFLSTGLSEEAYYEALKRYLDTPREEIAHIRQQAQESYKPFSMTECATRYEQLFHQL